MYQIFLDQLDNWNCQFMNFDEKGCLTKVFISLIICIYTFVVKLEFNHSKLEK